MHLSEIPIYFYYPRDIYQVDQGFLGVDGLDHWVFETYQRLIQFLKFKNIEAVNYIPAEGIILFHRGNFPSHYRPTNKQFLVCIQVDRGRHDFAHFHIVHNPFQTFPLLFPGLWLDNLFSFCGSAFIVGLPIKSIKQRNSSRKRSISTIGYHGNLVNLPKELKSEDFLRFLSDRNLKFITKDSPVNWNDYSEIDLSLCVRDFTRKKHYSKSFLKLTNSLAAGVPVIAGMESSHQYFTNKLMKVPQVKDLDELKNLIDRILAGNYDPFEQIRHFQLVANQFTVSEITIKWLKLLEVIFSKYSAWKASSYQRSFFYYMRTLIKRVR